MAVKTSVDPQLALSHAELPQVAVNGEGSRPVQPDHGQVTVHQDGGHILWSWGKGGASGGGSFLLPRTKAGGLMLWWYLH